MLEEKECSFTRLAFHLLSDPSLRCPECSWVPDVGFARENLPRTFLWTSDPMPRARERETGGGGEKETLTRRGTRAPLDAHTHALPRSSLPAERPPQTRRSRRPVGASVRLEKAGAVKPFISTRMPNPSLDWGHPGPPLSWKKHMHQSPARHPL